HDVAELVLRTRKPIAFDRTDRFEATGRFVIVDGYEISGGGIVLEGLRDESSDARDEARRRDFAWTPGEVSRTEREARFGHRAALVLLTGEAGTGKASLARALERLLFDRGCKTYLLDGQN